MSYNVSTEQSNEGPSQSEGIVRSVSPATEQFSEGPGPRPAGIAGSAHAALSLRWVHLPFRWFCHDAAQYWRFNVCASIHYRCAKFCLTFLN